jgi:hypothetical protein
MISDRDFFVFGNLYVRTGLTNPIYSDDVGTPCGYVYQGDIVLVLSAIEQPHDLWTINMIVYGRGVGVGRICNTDVRYWKRLT